MKHRASSVGSVDPLPSLAPTPFPPRRRALLAIAVSPIAIAGRPAIAIGANGAAQHAADAGTKSPGERALRYYRTARF